MVSTEENISVKNWLKKVMNTTTKKNIKTSEIFGAPLSQSLQVAYTYIAYEDKNTVIGFIPIVVAKCGSFLKDQGLYVEGVFRKSGSAKRVGELQHYFNSSSDYGRYLNWQLGFTVHDAANCLRRFLNYLPEPVIIYSLYEPFRQVIASEKESISMIQEFQLLIDQLPSVNQYLLFYLLDLLALFKRYAKYTKMNSMALASVFTPGILLNPDHAMNPSHYKLSQKVLLFLIDHHEHFHIHAHTIQTPPMPSHVYSNQKHHLLRANTVPVYKHHILNEEDPIQIINKQ